jgi:hypothetical protein
MKIPCLPESQLERRRMNNPPQCHEEGEEENEYPP